MELNEGEPIPVENLDTLAAESGIQACDLWPLIERGVTAGDIDMSDEEEVSLTEKGWQW
jgi:hypothetical protein